MRVVKYKGIPGAEITAPRGHTQRTLTIHRRIDVGKARGRRTRSVILFMWSYLKLWIILPPCLTPGDSGPDDQANLKGTLGMDFCVSRSTGADQFIISTLDQVESPSATKIRIVSGQKISIKTIPGQALLHLC